MQYNYELTNVIGSVYRQGNIRFDPPGSTLLIPVGNRLNLLNLEKHTSRTIDTQLQLNISVVALSPDFTLILLIDINGNAIFLHVYSWSILHTHYFGGSVSWAEFSPDGQKIIVAKGSTVFLYDSPSKSRNINTFTSQKLLYGAQDEVLHLDWASDSRAFLASSKDMNCRVYAVGVMKQLTVISLAGHNDCVVASFFEANSLDCFSIGRNGKLCVWQSDTNLADLEIKNKRKHEEISEHEEKQVVVYRLLSKFLYKNNSEIQSLGHITSASYHKTTHILVTGFDSGTFTLHEMPNFSLLHSLSIKDAGPITSLSFNETGDWVGIGAGDKGQLIVWEWRSESYILKQTGHFLAETNCVSWTPNGSFIATGGEDGRVKIWDVSSGHCTATFSDHSSCITGVVIAKNVVASSSLDGSIRLYDLVRYRNFRTLVTSEPTQFGCVDIDNSAELVAAGSSDKFSIYLWSVKSGQLLETLDGHEGPVYAIKFSPISQTLASGSWDKTVRLWGITENFREILNCSNEITAISWRPDGLQLAVADCAAKITFWRALDAEIDGSIDGRPYLGYVRSLMDKVTAKTASGSIFYNTIVYSADGKLILAAGNSPNICLFHVGQEILLKNYIVTCNKSLDAISEFLDRRKMTEWGNLALIEKYDGKETSLKLPGVKRGDFSSRRISPKVRIAMISWSDTSRQFAVASTDGILIYSLDASKTFNPIDLEINITPGKIREYLNSKDYFAALTMSLKLREKSLIKEVTESIPISNIELIVNRLSMLNILEFFKWITLEFEKTRHVHFYIIWIRHILFNHGLKLKAIIGSKSNDAANFSAANRDLNRVLKWHSNRIIPRINEIHSMFDLIENMSKLNNKKQIEDKIDENIENNDELII